MPVNFQQLQQQVREAGSRAPQRAQRLAQMHEDAQALLTQYANQQDLLRKRVEKILSRNPSLRCALPLAEALDAKIPLPDPAAPVAILAADGSQINPDRHAQIDFGVINVGVFRVLPGQGLPPQEQIFSRLLDWDDVNTEDGPMTEELVALERDLSERKVLSSLARQETLPVVTLTDGPLELFREPKDRRDYQEKFQEYLTALREMAGLKVATGGYVDRPRSDLLIRLLELMRLSQEELDDGTHFKRRFFPLVDLDLYFDLLGPGERSAVFGIQSNSAKKFTGDLALHFFYMNVGKAGAPSLARVEIPAWVVDSPVLLDQLQAVLYTQAQQMGGRPYPYALHRAHEVALVSFDEKRQLQDMIVRELRRQGLEVGHGSNKQFAKDHSGLRTRYKR